MESERLVYLTGEDIHVDQRVRYRGVPATIVFVSDGDNEEFAPGYEDYSGYERGVLLCDDDGATTFLPEANEDLELLS
jgi:hypothetical protein